MLEEDLKARGIEDIRVIQALEKVPREKFTKPQDKSLAYADMPLSIGYGQTISQPYIVAYMTEMAQINPSDRVLEIGTGCGYQTAVLAELAKEVFTIEIVPELQAQAEKTLLDELQYDNIRIYQGDGNVGLPDHAPFDAIVVTAAPKKIPENLIEQLAIGGRLIIPVGDKLQRLLRLTRSEDRIIKERLLPVRFVPLISSFE